MKCKNCLAWDEHKEAFGYCKRHSPRPEILKYEEGFEYRILWPSTGKDDWCCEYMRRDAQ